jgi:N-acyl amino acid synthase of PEP-CTERM/exosortase system
MMRSAALSVGRIAAKSAAALALLHHFDRYFEVVRADSLALREEAFRIRHEVYCCENAFEAASADGLERDDDDDRAAHALLRHRPSGTFAGTVRLVLPINANTHPLPTAAILSRQGIDLSERSPTARTGEVSRFVIRQRFRKRSADTNYADAEVGSGAPRAEQRIAPVLTLGLLRCSLSLLVEHDLAYACGLVETALPRILRTHGVELKSVGEPVEHRGKRIAFSMPVDELLTTLRRRRPEVWEVITDRGRYQPSPQSTAYERS